jgi:HAD superfamily hydrolase (TIGR01484 family)
MKYKLLLLDVDGTLVESRQGAMPTERVRLAVRSAQDKGVHVALVTGRAIYYAKDVILALGLQGPSVFNGGPDVMDVSTGAILHRRTISVEALRELVSLSVPFGYPIFTDADEYSTQILTQGDIIQEAEQFFVEAVQTKDAGRMVDALQSVKGVSALLASSWHVGDVVDIHVTHEHGTKRYGVEKLMRILGVRKEQVMGIGDGYNDLPMLEAAGFRVVMGQAPREVQAAADYVTGTLAQDGVAQAIEKFILTPNSDPRP